MSAKFYICRHCGNLVGVIHDSGVPMMCCGQKMEALEPNTVEASGEKHLPVVTVEDGAINVNVGSVNHPMAPEHFIEWVYVQTENGGQRKALKPNTVEASGEKHLPVVTVEDGAINVNVGSVNHPMAPEHFIEWVYVQTERGGQRKTLKPGDDPNVTFSLGDDKAVAVYAYCNLHGLWMTEV